MVAECAAKFSAVFFALFYELWRKQPFPIPRDDEIDPALRAQLATYQEGLGVDLPLGAGLTFLRCWVRLVQNLFPGPSCWVAPRRGVSVILADPLRWNWAANEDRLKRHDLSDAVDPAGALLRFLRGGPGNRTPQRHRRPDYQ